ncbi:sugar phosphate isomerase/epimerase family protein [Flagellimonas myxillae]|uniref:sugar phosphate isomerase/epimerase family protein n=1 Tax=Flagellimonas myxillae TaxID=2942214 RepID=UPI00201F9338|nr:sugar phosphate isomerase/epimerase family protein [Muricauda myxillae]MCL6266842.1 sugar phosphate isomerase/epimerase [Muricauda myxillae]
MKRKNFTHYSAKFVIVLLLIGNVACKQNKKQEEAASETVEEVSMSTEPTFKISLAQWSMHKMIRNDGVDPYSFAEKAKAWGFEGLEYVSGLYYKELEKDNFSEAAMNNFVEKSKALSEEHGLENLIIMIDGQGNLAATSEEERNAAVENHHKWVDAAAALGCHSIRVNLSGSTDPEEWTAASVDGLTKLATYAKDKNINILVENHGGLSSNGAMLANVFKEVNMENAGTLPDFGNFCITWGEWPECKDWYDRYKGMEEIMPYAKAVSAKSHDFDENGNEIHSDYARMLKIVKDAGYSGYIGVEYEGSKLSEEEGIIATRDLLRKLIK